MVLGLPFGWAMLVGAAFAAWLAVVALVIGRIRPCGAAAVSEPAIGGLAFAALLVLIALRMPVGLAMLACGAGGYVLLAGWLPFLAYLKTTPYYLFSNYTLSVIPLFILMGAFAERAGLSQALFAAASALVGHRRGGMAMAAIGACTAFGAICGSSVATTATMGRAALPELRRYSYARTAGDRHARRRRHARHPDPAFGDPGRLRDRDRAEHRQAVHGGPRPRPARLRSSICGAIAWCRAPRSRRRPRRPALAGAGTAGERCRGLAGAR